jgi:hypothetical protein
LRRELILRISRIGEASPEAVDGFAYNDLEFAQRRVRQKLLEAWPETTRSADRRIGVVLGDFPPLRLGIPAADLDLVFDRGLALQV